MIDINSVVLEKFGGYGSKVSRKISITRSFSFGLPPAFFKDNGLGRYTNVLLFYNKQLNLIVLKFETDDTNGGFKLVKYGEGDKMGASFVARSFFTTYNIDPKTYKGRYEAEKGVKDGIGEVFWIQLGKPQEN